MPGSATSLPSSTTGPAAAEKSVCSSVCLYKLRKDGNIQGKGKEKGDEESNKRDDVNYIKLEGTCQGLILL